MRECLVPDEVRTVDSDFAVVLRSLYYIQEEVKLRVLVPPRLPSVLPLPPVLVIFKNDGENFLLILMLENLYWRCCLVRLIPDIDLQLVLLWVQKAHTLRRLYLRVPLELAFLRPRVADRDFYRVNDGVREFHKWVEDKDRRVAVPFLNLFFT